MPEPNQSPGGRFNVRDSRIWKTGGAGSVRGPRECAEHSQGPSRQDQRRPDLDGTATGAGLHQEQRRSPGLEIFDRFDQPTGQKIFDALVCDVLRQDPIPVRPVHRHRLGRGDPRRVDLDRDVGRGHPVPGHVRPIQRTLSPAVAVVIAMPSSVAAAAPAGMDVVTVSTVPAAAVCTPCPAVTPAGVTLS